MEFDTQLLSRMQFAFTIMFHYLFPPLSIGLGTLMVIMEGLYLKTGNKHYETMTRFWTKVFAVNFAMGVATGVVMEFQFGTNWARYSRYVGDVFGSALAAEGIFAFFLESGFLAVLVFGWDRVSPKMHFFSTVMVALGSIFSSVWIVIANSWQHTPAGHHIVGTGKDARAEIIDFWAMVFNPSSMHRLGHVVLGAFILGAFFVMSISAFYILKGRHLEFARRSFTIALLFGAACCMGEMLSGDMQAKMVAKYQPAKLAALEAHFETGEGPSGLVVFGLPDEKAQKVQHKIEIPYLLSFLVHMDFKTPVIGLDQFKPEDRPPVLIPFAAYHTMLGLGMYMLGVIVLALYFLWKKKLFETRWLMWVFVFSVVAPYGANQAGWVAAEVGRQPWVVYGLFRTRDAFSTAVKPGEVMASLAMFGFIYLLLFAVFIYVLNEKIQHGPEEAPAAPLLPPTQGVFSAAGLRAGKGGTMMLARQDKPKDKPPGAGGDGAGAAGKPGTSKETPG